MRPWTLPKEHEVPQPPRTDYGREELIQICERAIVSQSDWINRDSESSMRKVGEAWALLRAGCEFTVLTEDRMIGSRCITDERTIWIEIFSNGFQWFELGGEHVEISTFYLPTPDRLDKREGKDWYC